MKAGVTVFLCLVILLTLLCLGCIIKRGNTRLSILVFPKDQQYRTSYLNVIVHERYSDDLPESDPWDLVGLEDHPDVIPPRDPYDVIGKDDHPDVWPPRILPIARKDVFPSA